MKVPNWQHNSGKPPKRKLKPQALRQARERLQIIKFVIQDANIFVISHKQSLHDRFQSMIQFEKVKGFSRMVLGYKEQNENT